MKFVITIVLCMSLSVPYLMSQSSRVQQRVQQTTTATDGVVTTVTTDALDSIPWEKIAAFFACIGLLFTFISKVIIEPIVRKANDAQMARMVKLFASANDFKEHRDEDKAFQERANAFMDKFIGPTLKDHY